jgi:triacylglycerol lipase
MPFLLVLFCVLIKFIFWLVALTVLLSYTVAWYEHANSRRDLIDGRFTGRNLAMAFWLMTQETASLLLTILLRPLGWLPVKMPPEDAGVQKPPVILLHGLFQNRSCMFWMQSRIRANGYRQAICISTPPWREIESQSHVLAKAVEELCMRTKAGKVILVGHSMGGIIARHYVQNRGGAVHIAQVITLGSPHHGSKLAPFAISPMGKTLMPGSDFLNQLNECTWPGNSKAVSIYTRHDNMVIPVASSRMDGFENIELGGMGHTSLLFNPLSIRTVIDTLIERTT